MKKKYESVFGEVEKESFKREIKSIFDIALIVMSICAFPFASMGIVYGAFCKDYLILAISAVALALVLFLILFFGFIIPTIVKTRGEVISARAIKVHGSYVKYEYVDADGNVKRSSGNLMRISKYSTGSVIDIKVYKGRSILNK